MHLQSKDPFFWEDCGLATGYTTLIDFVNPYGNVVSTCWRRLREGTSPPVYREMGQHGQGGYVPVWATLHVIMYLCKSTAEHPCVHKGNGVPVH